MTYSDIHTPHSTNDATRTQVRPLVAWLHAIIIAEPIAGAVCAGLVVAALTNSIAGLAFAALGTLLYRSWVVEASTRPDRSN